MIGTHGLQSRLPSARRMGYCFNKRLPRHAVDSASELTVIQLCDNSISVFKYRRLARCKLPISIWWLFIEHTYPMEKTSIKDALVFFKSSVDDIVQVESRLNKI